MAPTIDEIASVGAEIKLVDLDAQRLKDEAHELLRQADAAKAKADGLRKRLQQMVEAFQSVSSATGDQPAEPHENDADQPRPIVEQVREWFLTHPDVEARAGDVHESGIGKSTNSLRSTLHRLVNDGFLAQPKTGTFMLAAPDEPTEPAKKKKGGWTSSPPGVSTSP